MAPRGIITKLLGLFAACLAWPVGADPARLPTVVFDTPPTGGYSVSGFGEWGIIANRNAGGGACALRLYRIDYQTMAWEFFGQILESNPQCDNTEFGISSSLVGDVLVVGAPGWAPGANPRGAFFVYVFDGVIWDEAIKQQAADSAQQNSRYGESVSITRVPGTDEYLIAVGSPHFDSGGTSNGGKVEVWHYNSVSNNLEFVGDSRLAVLNANLGASVTTDYPFVLAGAPGAVVTGGTATGLVRLLEATDGGDADTIPDGLPVRQTLPANGTALNNQRLGANVSMSAAYALITGDDQAFIFANTGTASNRTYVVREQPAGTPYALPAESMGDVTQSAGIGAIASGVPGSETVSILRDPLTDDFNLHAVDTKPTVDPGGVMTDMDDDIRLVRETLWFSNEVEDRAFLFQYPAGYGMRQQPVGAAPPYKYYQRSLPCDAVGKTVGLVFADIPGGNAADGGTGFVVYLYDDTQVNAGSPYTGPLEDAYAFTAADLNYSLWLAVAQDGYVEIADCAGFSVPTYTAAGGFPFAMPGHVKAVKYLQLPDRHAVALRARVMVNNPFPREVNLNDIRYVDEDGLVGTLIDADADDRISSRFYIYDTGGPTLPSGQNYRTLAPNTPPFGNTIQPQEGFWVIVEQNGIQGGAMTHNLVMPQVE